MIGDVLNALVVVVCGIVLWIRPQLYFLDPILAFGIGLWLIVSSYGLGKEAIQVMMEMPIHLPVNLDNLEIL